MAIDQSPRILLLLLLQLLQPALHLVLFALNSLPFSLLPRLSILFLLLVLSLRFHDLLVHGRPLLLEQLLLLLFALPSDAVLLCKLTELDFIEGHIPVDGLLILLLLFSRVVCNCKRLRSAFFDALETVLLDQLPGKLFLLHLSQVLSAILSYVRGG